MRYAILLLIAAACQPSDPVHTDTDSASDTDVATDTDPAADTDVVEVSDDTDITWDVRAFADRVVSFTAGEFAGYGQDKLPDVVLGRPEGRGPSAGSLHVLSLGKLGEIVLALDDLQLVDGDGPDLLVFENAFSGWYETGEVSVSEDGTTWFTWPCHDDDAEGGFPGCAGVASVLSSSKNGLDPTNSSVAGGDAFDLADLGVTHARFVRIVDSGANDLEGPLGYFGNTGGFDLDAIAVVNGELAAD